jgi:transcriptional regulator with XRE-family HTH domain
MGIDAPALSRLEMGKVLNPTLATLHKWAEALGQKLGVDLSLRARTSPKDSRRAQRSGRAQANWRKRMVGTLAVPLSANQIKSAKDCWPLVPEWQLTNRSLQLLKEKVPDFSREACVLKVTTLNTLYGTRILAVVRMAEHVHSVMAKPVAENAGVELVERLAALPSAAGEASPRNETVFASKFAHVYINPESFPLLDFCAEKMLEYHLGRWNYKADRRHPHRYVTFVTHLHQLKQMCQLSVSDRELDQYLWLAGLYREYESDPKKAQINAGARKLFESKPECLKGLLSECAS